LRRSLFAGSSSMCVGRDLELVLAGISY